MKRKLLSILLTLCLALGLLPTAALADEATGCVGGETCNHQAAIGSTHYDTLQEAVNAATASDTVTLLDNLENTGKIVLPEGVTLDGQNHQITGNSSVSVNAGGGTVKNVAFKNIHDGATLTDTEKKQYGIQNKTGKLTALYGSGLTGKLEVTGCTFENVDWDAIQITPKANAEIVITDNVFSTSVDCQTIRFVHVQSDQKTDFSITVTQNKFTGVANLNQTGLEVYYPTNPEKVVLNHNYMDAPMSVCIGTGGTSYNNAWEKAYPFVAEDLQSEIRPVAMGLDSAGNNRLYLTLEDAAKDDYIALTDGRCYKTLAEAVKVADNATVTLLKDTTEDITIPSGKTVTLDLNGKTLTNVKDHTILNNGNLTITGAGTVDNVSHQKGALYNKGTVIVNGGTFDRTKENGKNKGESGQNSWYTIKNVGTMTINDGATVQTAGNNAALGKFSSLVSNGYFDANDYNTNKGLEQPILTIDGGTFRGGLNTIKNDDRAKLTINGGTFSNYYQAVVQNHNIAEITGGTFTAASDANAKTYGIYNCGCAADIDLGTLTVSGGTFTGATYAVADVSSENADVTISGGQFAGTKAAIVKSSDSKATITVTGGLFSSDPSAYVADGHYVDASNNGDYPYTVKVGTKPAGALIVVKDKTDAAVNEGIKTEDKKAIHDVIGDANIDGVAEAVTPAKKADIVMKSGVTLTGSEKVEIEIAVKVEAKDADLVNGKLTFEVTPEATVKVDGTEQSKKVPVTNDMLNGKPITVKLPLPTVNGSRFTPKQILHKFTGGGYEYFINESVGGMRGAGRFKIEDNCAVFTIYGFSTFELSGTVTYVEPSYSSGSSYDPTYSVTVDKTKNGAVTVSPKSASKGDTVTVTVKPDSGYVLETLTVTDKNGNELTLKDKGNGKYTFTMPAGKVEVKATFMEDNSMLNFFYDVPNNAYFYEAVKWAVKNGITTGVGNDLFAPEQPCTRAQIVTFLWRAAGSPEPKGAASGMTDVVSGSYYEKAVAWAIENGITTGTTTSTFSPDATCTRAQAVTFLARALKAKAASAAEFSDVPTGSYFADAVAWAAANGVTEGIGGGLFGSDNDCTRGQIVTFLYRAYNK